jgi:hypothetical protein
MERWTSLLGVFILPAAVLAAPALVINPPSVDLGFLEGDVTVPFGFTLRNDGDSRPSTPWTTCGARS